VTVTVPSAFCRAHAFVVMPFGTKPAADGTIIDFNRVYAELIRPALELAGLDPFRADQEVRAGDIRTDMFQELLLADLVLADLTIDNPNVWYELGVRHALRARGVVLISGGRVTTAFDLYTDRKVRYGLREGGPDPASVASDREAIAGVVRATMESWKGRRVSPVYALLPQLQEPEWEQLRVGDVREFWEAHDAWKNRVDRARRAERIGDVLVLADEAPVAAFRARAWIEAGVSLRKAERYSFAIEQLDRGLAIEPDNLVALREKGTCLERLAKAGEPGHSVDRALQHYDAILALHPNDAETWALAGRVLKDDWEAGWRDVEDAPDQHREAALDGMDSLLEAQSRYLRGFRADPCNYYAGINALTLMHLGRHLGCEDQPDKALHTLAGAVRFAAESEHERSNSFWAITTLADLAVLEGSIEDVSAAYRRAVAQREMDRFALDSCRVNLQLLQALSFRPDVVSAAIAILDRAIARAAPLAEIWRPRLAILFSGHRIDTPDRAEPRFPPALEAVALERIEKALAELDAGEQDIAFCQAASGGDLLFLEACQRRKVRCQVLLPFEEAIFLQKSVLSSCDGEHWRERYFALKERLQFPPRILPEELGPGPPERSPYERCNTWLLYSALACGLSRVRFLCLWDGQHGDGPGGTAHLHQEVERRTGRIQWIDTRTLATIE
jgi:tetratricopeptide (TPR) repeat protein